MISCHMRFSLGTGLGKTSVHDALHGKAGRKSTRAVDEFLEESLREG